MNLKFIFLVVLLFSIISCGKTNSGGGNASPPSGPEYSPLFISSNSEFDIFLNEFANQYEIYRMTNFAEEIPPINFYDLESLPYLSKLAIVVADYVQEDSHFSRSVMAGVCLSYPNGKKEILIDPAVWDQIDSGAGCNGNCFERKQALIFHELGHCVLGRTHKDDKYLGFNLSIMNSTLTKQSDVVRWENAYFEELFTNNHSHVHDSIRIYEGL